jgi:trimethylamine--corrinoid protein Co-methyltransferase
MKNQFSEFLSPSDTQAIHDTSMRLLTEIGIRFPEDTALSTFKKHNFKIEGDTVFFTEDQILRAIQETPSQFSIHARNSKHDVTIGDGNPVFAPGYGAPFLVDPENGKCIPTMEDYNNLAKLAHMLPNQDLSGHLMVQPQDIPSKSAHLQMLQACILHSDKPFIGSTNGFEAAQQTMDLIEILFGEKPERPVTIGIINPLSPLSYSSDMIEALIVYAQARQPFLISALVMAGSTGSITLAGVIAQQNAEILAGIVLAQLIQPGLPVIYGSTSTNIDMRTGMLAIGSPELSLCISAHAQMAHYYKLPCRSGGSLTDSSMTDAQAGFESMFSLLTTVNSGIDFVLHAAGILSGYMAFSFEKFVLDDEMCGMMRKFLRGIEVSPETLAYDVIEKVGHDGHFLGEDHTLERCRTELWQPQIVNRTGLESWNNSGRKDVTYRARKRWQELLAQHEDPPIDKTVARQLIDYINKKNNQPKQTILN